MTYQDAFLADLHLAPNHTKTLAAFERFLVMVPQFKRVFILGDLFDLFLGHSDKTLQGKFEQSILQKLSTLADEHDVPIFLMRSNRDALLRHKSLKNTKLNWLKDGSIFEVAGEKTVLLHGDALCTDDIAYQRFRRIAQNPLAQSIYYALPESLTTRFLKKIQSKSKTSKAKKSDAIMDVSEKAVIDYFIEHPCQNMIHGHTHRPNIHNHEINGVIHKRYVLKDWDEYGYLLVSQGNVLKTLVI